MLQYYLFLIISFSGLAIGWFLARLAWEEVDMYEMFLKGIQVACALGAFILTILYTQEIAIPVMLLLVYSLFYFTNRYRGAYAVLPIFLWLVFPSQYFSYVASTLFLYGFPEGSLRAFEQGEKGRETDGLLTVLRSDYWFLAVGVILGIAL